MSRGEETQVTVKIRPIAAMLSVAPVLYVSGLVLALTLPEAGLADRALDPLWPVVQTLHLLAMLALVLGATFTLHRLHRLHRPMAIKGLAMGWVGAGIGAIAYGLTVYAVPTLLGDGSAIAVGPEHHELVESLFSSILLPTMLLTYAMLAVMVIGLAHQLRDGKLIGHTTARAGYLAAGLVVALAVGMLVMRPSVDATPAEYAATLLFLWAGAVGVRLWGLSDDIESDPATPSAA